METNFSSKSGFALGQQLFHLIMLNHLLQDDAAGFEVAAGCGLGVGGHGFAARIVRPMLMHRRAAFGASA
jgi:hypothetical protein